MSVFTGSIASALMPSPSNAAAETKSAAPG
jgi:hypothetical protein